MWSEKQVSEILSNSLIGQTNPKQPKINFLLKRIKQAQGNDEGVSEHHFDSIAVLLGLPVLGGLIMVIIIRRWGAENIQSNQTMQNKHVGLRQFFGDWKKCTLSFLVFVEVCTITGILFSLLQSCNHRLHTTVCCLLLLVELKTQNKSPHYTW